MNIFINYSLNIHLFTLFLIPYYLKGEVLR